MAGREQKGRWPTTVPLHIDPDRTVSPDAHLETKTHMCSSPPVRGVSQVCAWERPLPALTGASGTQKAHAETSSMSAPSTISTHCLTVMKLRKLAVPVSCNPPPSREL